MDSAELEPTELEPTELEPTGASVMLSGIGLSLSRSLTVVPVTLARLGRQLPETCRYVVGSGTQEPPTSLGKGGESDVR